MTVTIKKNVDVQATLEANQLKYQVKRDLSGDVQWVNAANAGALAISASRWGAGLTTDTVQTVGFNFIKIPKVQIQAYAYSGSSTSISVTVEGKLKVNGVTKVSSIITAATTNDYTKTVTSTITPTTVTQTITGASPNTFTAWASVKLNKGFSADGFARNKSAFQINDKVTVMK